MPSLDKNKETIVLDSYSAKNCTVPQNQDKLLLLPISQTLYEQQFCNCYLNCVISLSRFFAIWL